MSTLASLRASITGLSPEDALELVRKMRLNRKIYKGIASIGKTKKVKKAKKKVDLVAIVEKMTPEDLVKVRELLRKAQSDA